MPYPCITLSLRHDTQEPTIPTFGAFAIAYPCYGPFGECRFAHARDRYPSRTGHRLELTPLVGATPLDGTSGRTTVVARSGFLCGAGDIYRTGDIDPQRQSPHFERRDECRLFHLQKSSRLRGEASDKLLLFYSL